MYGSGMVRKKFVSELIGVRGMGKSRKIDSVSEISGDRRVTVKQADQILNDKSRRISYFMKKFC